MTRAARILPIVLALALAFEPGSAWSEEFDRTVPVSRGMRLDVRLFGGSLSVRGSARQSVRVRATHVAGDLIDVRVAGTDVQVRARVGGKAPHPIDVTIEVPAWMPISMAGTYLDMRADGIAADVTAETVRGDVRVRGGAGTIVLRSIEGIVTLEDGRGRARLSSANNLIRVTRLTGDLQADTVTGDIKLLQVTAGTVDAATVGGGIEWEGPFSEGGRYQFVTHSGDIDVTIGARTDARLAARAFAGTLRSVLDPPAVLMVTSPFSLLLGTGSADIDLETYNGTISLRR